MRNILFVASEGVPFIKTGGLADVVGSLPKNIDKEYYDVRVILPKYSCMRQEMKDKMEYVTSFYMDFDWKSMYVGLLKAEVDGVVYYFIDNEDMFNTYKPYTDDALFEIRRFSFFSKATGSRKNMKCRTLSMLMSTELGFTLEAPIGRLFTIVGTVNVSITSPGAKAQRSDSGK